MFSKSAFAALFILFPAIAAAHPDTKGWDGPGWYISGGASLAPALPVYTLFNGPHGQQAECLQVYDQFYSPIGRCRYLNAKPGGAPQLLSKE